MQKFYALGCALAQSLVLSGALAASGTLNLAINDTSTHYGVPALVRGVGPESFSLYADDAGLLKRELTSGEYQIEVTAPGYKNMKSEVTVRDGKTTNLGFMLTPLSPPEEENLVPSRLRPGFTLIRGYVTDDRNQPLAGVRVRMEKADTETVTDRRGYYWLSVPTPPETAPDVAGTDTLIAEKAGYKTVIHQNMLIGGEDAGGVFIGMERGIGRIEFDDTHRMMRRNVEPQAEPPAGPLKKRNLDQSELLNATAILVGTAAKGSSISSAAAVAPAAVTVPSTIKVGLSCTDPNKVSTCTTCNWGACNSARTYELEVYVQMGLAQEWPSQYHENSMKAGAVAYRSYGAY
jgi:carboxypeptidase family protein/PEGA domain-containing protein